MKITGIKVKLTEQDILENINEYVKVNDFKVENIFFDGKINLECTYKKGIKITLKVKIQIDKVSQNVLYLNILDVNISKIHILSKIKNMALKSILKDFEKYGVNIDKDIISLDIETLCQVIPFVEFKLVRLEVLKGAIEAEVKDLVILQDKEVRKEIEKVEILTKRTELVPFVKVEDKYSKLRKKILKKVPDKYVDLAEYAMLVPDIVILFGRLLKDKRVPIKNKIVIGSIVTYLVSPINLGVLFIPFVGDISSIAIAFYGLSYVMEELPEQIIIENWQGKEAFALKIGNVVEVLNKASGGRNIDKLINFSKKNSIKGFLKK